MVTDHNRTDLVAHDTERLKVCIVGTGAAGLCAIRKFITRLDRFDVTAYEQTSNIGGTWNYHEEVGVDQNGLPIHSSMYKNLSTNLPMEIMEYPDFKSNCAVSYVHHTEVLAYLVKYAKHFDVFRYIKFNHQIVNISRLDNSWKVIVTDVDKRQTFTKFFDIVLLCTGRYSLPYWPQYDTLKLFQGNVIHSHDYRVPEVYKGQRVAVIGGGLSGVDICIEISSFAEQVVLINRSEYHFKNLPSNIIQTRDSIQFFDQSSMTVLSEQTGQLIRYELDSLIFATGYMYNLEFVDESSSGISVNPDSTLNGVYRHLINIKNPSMALLALSPRILPFPLYNQQIAYFMKIWLGEMELPSEEQMHQEVKEDMKMRKEMGLRDKDRHMMNVDIMEKYVRQLEKEAGLKPLRNVVISLYRALYKVRCESITTYKKINYKLISNDEYCEI